MSGHLLLSLFDDAKKQLDKVIAKKEMAKAAITRSFFFEELNKVIKWSDYSILPSVGCQGDSTIKCCDCPQTFRFTAAEKIKFDAKTPPWSYPKRCKGCALINRQRQAALQNDSPATALPITHENDTEPLAGGKDITCQR